MDVRYASHPDEFESYTTERTRAEFLVSGLFTPGQVSLTYSHIDRMVIGGACPIDALKLEADKELGVDFFLERREIGVINIGPKGSVTVDGALYEMDKTDCLYIGLGSKDVVFESADSRNPAHFYLLSGPAHKQYPITKTTIADTEAINLGGQAQANERTLNKLIHPGGIKSCGLVMGITALAPGNVWNTVPSHTHGRRSEAYLYFDLAEDAIVFHFMGEPDKTRHVIVKNEEAVISPSWSIHSGAGTSNYTFIWGMLGDNQDFSDMDGVAIADMK